MPWHKKPKKLKIYQQLPTTRCLHEKKTLLQWSHTVLNNGLLRLYTKISTTTSIQQPLSRRWWWWWCKWRANVLVLTWTSERAPTHSLLLWLGWSLNAYYSTFGVCVCEKGDVFCGLWVVNAIVFVCFKSSLTFTFYSFAGIFFSVLFASMWVNKTHCFGGFARWGGTHTQSGVSVRKWVPIC